MLAESEALLVIAYRDQVITDERREKVLLGSFHDVGEITGGNEAGMLLVRAHEGLMRMFFVEVLKKGGQEQGKGE